MVGAWPEKQGFPCRKRVWAAVMPRQRGVRAPDGAVGDDGRGMVWLPLLLPLGKKIAGADSVSCPWPVEAFEGARHVGFAS